MDGQNTKDQKTWKARTREGQERGRIMNQMRSRRPTGLGNDVSDGTMWSNAETCCAAVNPTCAVRQAGVGARWFCLLMATCLVMVTCLGMITLQATLFPTLSHAQVAEKAEKQKLGRVTLVALLTQDSKPVSRGLIWRIYEPTANNANLLQIKRAATPTFQLPSGKYIVNVSYGLAYLTRVITVKPGKPKVETFVLNAGGLQVQATLSDGAPIPAGNVSYDIFSDERDQNGRRLRVLTKVKPGKIVRLNSGIYQLTSRIGDANAQLSAEVTVEAGKLTEATFAHDAGKCTLKLVRTAGGEALADVEWVIISANGAVVKKSAGALPTHILAPGNYRVNARWKGQSFTRGFTLQNGENIEVEVSAN